MIVLSGTGTETAAEAQKPLSATKNTKSVRRAAARENFVPTPADFVPFLSMAMSRRERMDPFNHDRAVAE